MGEIITLQFGPESSHIAAHFWEAQEHGRAATRSLFRTVTSDRTERVVPRALVFDTQDARVFPPLLRNWDSAPSASESCTGRPRFGIGSDRCDLLDAPAVTFHPRSLVKVGGRSATGDCYASRLADTLSSASQFDAFTDGALLFDHEAMLEPLRWQLEDCDHLQGAQVLVDVDAGWGGLAHTLLGAAQDDYFGKAAPLLVYGVSNHGAAARVATARLALPSTTAAPEQNGAADAGGAAGQFDFAARGRDSLRIVNLALALCAFGGGAGHASAEMGVALDGSFFVPLGGGAGAGSDALQPSACAAAVDVFLSSFNGQSLLASEAAASRADAAAAGGPSSSSTSFHGSQTATLAPARDLDAGIERATGASAAGLPVGSAMRDVLALLSPSSCLRMASVRLNSAFISAPAGCGQVSATDLARRLAGLPPPNLLDGSAAALMSWPHTVACYRGSSGSRGAVTAAAVAVAAPPPPIAHLCVLRSTADDGAGAGCAGGGGGGGASSDERPLRGRVPASADEDLPSTAAAYGRVLDGWLERAACSTAAHTLVRHPLLQISPCSSSSSSGGDAPAHRGGGGALALLVASVGADVAGVVEGAHARLARADGSVLYRYAAASSGLRELGLRELREGLAGLLDAFPPPPDGGSDVD